MSFSDTPMNSGTKKKPISIHERKTLDILRTALPDHEVFPNMRLADAIKADKYLFNQIKGFHLDFVICDQHSNIVAAVELDDPTHDNQKSQMRDAKKDIWLREADIKLIRIRHPEEAINIQELIDNYKQVNHVISADSPFYLRHNKVDNNSSLYSHFESQPTKYQQKNKNNFKSVISNTIERRVGQLVIKTFAALLAFAIIFAVFSNIMDSTINKPIDKLIQGTSQQQLETKAQNHIQLPDQQQEPKIMKQSPHYESVWITGKSAKDCANINDGILDNSTIKCMQGHYELMDVNNPDALHRILQKP